MEKPQGLVEVPSHEPNADHSARPSASTASHFRLWLLGELSLLRLMRKGHPGREIGGQKNDRGISNDV